MISKNPEKKGCKLYKKDLQKVYDQRLKAEIETMDALMKIRKHRKETRIKRIEEKIKDPEKKIETIFGKRTESYFDEEEIYSGYIAPKYKDLSEEEKVIFNNIK